MTVLAANNWKTNGDLILDVLRLGYVNPSDKVLDTTYGMGTWWAMWRPLQNMVACDLNTEKSPIGFSVDFRYLPFRDSYFDVVTYDPPYKLNGRPSTPDMDYRYGTDVYTPWQERIEVMKAGLVECARVVKPGGRVLAKVQDQVVSGRMVWQTDIMTATGYHSGLNKVDRFDLLGTHRPQPKGRRQIHAHGRPSTLLVFQKV